MKMSKSIVLGLALASVGQIASAQVHSTEHMKTWIESGCEQTSEREDVRQWCAAIPFAYQDKVEDMPAVFVAWSDATNSSHDACQYMNAGLKFYLETPKGKELWIKSASPIRMTEAVANTTSACQPVRDTLERIHAKSVTAYMERNTLRTADAEAVLTRYKLEE